MTDCNDCLAVREAEHRISNHLAMLSGILHLRADALLRRSRGGDEEAVRILFEIRAHLDAVARLHRALSVKGRTRETDLAESLGEAVMAFSSFPRHSDLVLDLEPDCMMPPAGVLAISQIVIEAITNASKHGKGPVTVRCLRGRDRSVLVEVSDRGPGLPDAFDPRTSKRMGMSLIRRLGERVGATVEFLSGDDGLTVRLKVPAPRDCLSARSH